MSTLLIIYHSQSGSSTRLAMAAWKGARQEIASDVVVQRVWDAGSADIANADGILLIAAENSGALSGGMKDFLDRTFYPSIARGLVRPYALVVTAGNDGSGAVKQGQRILSGYPFSPAVAPLVFKGEVTDAHCSVVAELGQAFAAGLEMGIY